MEPIEITKSETGEFSKCGCGSFFRTVIEYRRRRRRKDTNIISTRYSIKCWQCGYETHIHKKIKQAIDEWNEASLAEKNRKNQESLIKVNQEANELQRNGRGYDEQELFLPEMQCY